MRIGEWEGIGRARAVVQRELGDLGATELASHVQVAENGRMRILVATDIGLLDFAWAPNSPDPQSPWMLRGSLIKWASVRGLRLQMDAQFDPATEQVASVWRLVAEEPKIELGSQATVETKSGSTDRPNAPLLDFARAAIGQAG